MAFVLKVKISVTVSRGDDRVERDGEILRVYTREPFEGNRANRDVIKQVAKYYAVGSTSVKIMSGFASRRKILIIEEES